jgi:hypothetical protein
MKRVLSIRSMSVLLGGGLALALSACSDSAHITSVNPARPAPADRPSLALVTGDFAAPPNAFASTTISPNASTCTVGSTCAVDVGMWVGGYATYGIDFTVKFDPTVLQAASVTTAGGSPYPNSPALGDAHAYPPNSIDNVNGLVSYSAMSAPGAARGGMFVVATIAFTPIGAGTSTLVLRTNQWIVGTGPYGITGLAKNGTVTVSAGTPTPKVFTSGANVMTWDPIFELNQPPYPDWIPQYCTMTPKVGLGANWVAPHNAFVLTGHPWADSYFLAPWINAWNSLASSASGSPNLNYNWTKYETMVEGNGSFVVRLLADNCSWIYLDDRLVGVQGGDLSKNSYGVTLNGKHRLDFIIFDGGGAAGGKFILETTTNPPPPLVIDRTPPVITHTITGTAGTGDWYKSPVTVTWTVKDDESAITSPACLPQTISASTAAAGVVVRCSATSAGGTSEDPVTVKLDLSVPTVVANVPAATGANGWYTSDIPVSWTVGNAGPSGIVTTCPSTAVNTETTGITLSCAATTGAGLSATGNTATLKLDKTPPVLKGVPTGPLGNNQWYLGSARPTPCRWTTRGQRTPASRRTTLGCPAPSP